MPKNPLKQFGRRRSSGNVLDDATPSPTAPPHSSFRVLERPDKIPFHAERASQDRLRQVNRPFNSPLNNLRGRSVEELGGGLNRGSGGTTNSGSSGYYDSSGASARHSSSSTLPSSVDAERDDEELFPRKSRTTPMHHPISANPADPLPPPPSFSSRAARALSFGQKNTRNGSVANTNGPLPPLPNGMPRSPERSHSPHRERAMTTSSYASTAKPTRPEPNLSLGSSDFGDDFGSIFDKPKDEWQTAPLPPVPPIGGFHRTESEPMFPPRTHSRQGFKPSPNQLHDARDKAGSPYSLDDRNSNDGLMSSSALSSPRLPEDGPPVPAHGRGLAPAFLGSSKSGYSLVPERYSSPAPERRSQDSQSSSGVEQEKAHGQGYGKVSQTNEEDRWIKRVELRDSQEPASAASGKSFASEVSSRTLPGARKPIGQPPQLSTGVSRAGAMSPDGSEGGGSLWGSESRNTTPRAGKLELPRHEDEPLFDTSPSGPPSRAIRPGAVHSRTESGTPKKMTKAQFERLQRRGDGSNDQSDGEEEHLADDYDDEDDVDRAKKLSKQRQKQEANMSVYRQQMKKVTGGGPSDLPAKARPSLDRAAASAPASSSFGSIHMSGIGSQPPVDAVRGKASDDDDDDVPLGILQAHGFPGANRPPTRAENDAATQRRMSATGSVVGGGAGQGNLPPFARRLPADPYFGASVVNQTNRESLGFGGAAPSVYGGAQQMPPQMQQQMMQQQQAQPQMAAGGGLVGVIASEERARAARRGSPNPTTGAFNPVSNNMPGQMPGVPGMPPRTMSMGNIAPPQVYMPTGFGPGQMMPPMPQMPQMMMPNPQQEQMQQFMQMQMQLMQSMLNMQSMQQMGQQTPQPQPQPATDYLSLGQQQQQQRLTSILSQAPSQHPAGPQQGRAMTMMNPPTRWDFPNQAGAPRPNSALPTAYTPSSMALTPGGGPGPGYTPSIAPSERSNIGQPSRYRPVNGAGGFDAAGRSQSMTSSMTLLALGNPRRPSPDALTPRPQTRGGEPQSTIRLVDKPKGMARVTTKAVVPDEDDDEGWAEMRKKREDRKKFRFGGRKEKDAAASPVGPSLGELYQGLD